MIIAFFDFDGTITKKDSFIDFVIFTEGKKKVWIGIIVNFISIIGYYLGINSGHFLKEKLLTYFYKDLDQDRFSELGIQYSKSALNKTIRPKALKRIEWHKEQGHQVVVVSASISQWLEPWCKRLEIDCIATEIEFKNNKLTGKLKGNNCIGPEKVSRINKKYNLKTSDYIYAYGNSRGDKEILNIANEKFYRYF